MSTCSPSVECALQQYQPARVAADRIPHCRQLGNNGLGFAVPLRGGLCSVPANTRYGDSTPLPPLGGFVPTPASMTFNPAVLGAAAPLPRELVWILP